MVVVSHIEFVRACLQRPYVLPSVHWHSQFQQDGLYYFRLLPLLSGSNRH